MTQKFAFIGMAVLLWGACKARTESQGQDGQVLSLATNATPGIPTFYLGVQDLTNSSVDFDTGKSNTLGTITASMRQIPGTGGYGTTRPIPCNDAETWANGSSALPASMLCHVEFVGTGRLSQSKNGIALHIIPLGSGGAGFSESTFAAKTTPMTPGAVAAVNAGPPPAPNSGMDAATVERGIQQLKTKFGTAPGNVLASYAQDCLKNARAANWSDIQAHYYCLLPYTIRYCFSTILAEQKNPVKALSYCSDAANAADWQANRDPLLHPQGPGSADWQWLLTNQGALFKYLMFSQEGVKDFNLEAQNTVINRSFAGVPRVRRAVDTYPAWAAKQPRYDLIRQKQGSGGTLPPPLPPPPSFSPTPPPPGGSVVARIPKVGLYSEGSQLESIPCTARVDKVTENTPGKRLNVDITGGNQCELSGSRFNPGIAATVVCATTLESCVYTTTLSNLSPFKRNAKIGLKGEIIVLRTDVSKPAFTWAFVSP